MEMQLTRLLVTRAEYGKDKGRLSGNVEFAGPNGKVELPLDEKLSHEILAICADGVVRASQQIATELTAQVINEVPMLESGAD